MNMLTTAVLVVDYQGINWEQVKQLGYYTEYVIPYAERRWDYLQNWYLRESEYPYYMNTAAGKLFVKYPSQEQVRPLLYEERAWTPKPMDIQAPALFHALIKLLMSDFFTRRQILVSNNDFFLTLYMTEAGNLRVLKLNFRERKIDDQRVEFIIEDEAKTMIRIQEVGSVQGAHYFLDHQGRRSILRRLHPARAATSPYIQQGIYIRLRRTTYRTKVNHLHVGSEYQLRRCRVYHLWWFINDLVDYFNGIGIPVRMKESRFQKVNLLSTDKFNQPQLDMSQRTVYIVDDRLRPAKFRDLEPDGFVEVLVERLRSLAADHQTWTPTLVPAAKSQLQAGDLVLRLQDNGREDIKPEVEEDESGQTIQLTRPLLEGYDDPYEIFSQEYGHTIHQSLTVNTLAARGEDDDDDSDTDEAGGGPQSVLDFMSYKLPTKAWLKTRLLNSFYQLQLKDVVRNRDGAIERLPALALMRDNIFLHADGLVYLDGERLEFMPLTNNPAALDLIAQRTGWDLLDHILDPAMTYQYAYAKEQEKEEKRQLILKNGRFIVNRAFVWQIDDSTERVLPNIPEIEARLRDREMERPKDDFRPTYSEAELKVFTREQLQAFEAFLDEEVPEFISFATLIRKDYRERFYSRLDIAHRSRKFRDYLAARGLVFKSPKGGDVIPAYTGISYLPETQQYYVGDKAGMDERYRQEKGFVLRNIVVYQPEPCSPPTLDQLKENLFPLLEVNFIRYKRYTVYPFPFKLIEIWKELNKGISGPMS